MGIFDRFSNRGKVVDLGEVYKRNRANSLRAKKEIEEQKVESEPAKSFSPFGFFDSAPSNAPVEDNSYPENSPSDERKRKLALRFKEMTGQIENLENTVYKLEQRIEFLERKVGA